MFLVKAGRYAQKSEWRNGKVVSRQCGSGAFAIWAAVFDLASAEDREEQRREARARREEQERLYLLEHQRGRTIETLLTIALESLGFARYQRYPWKRRHMKPLPDNGAPHNWDEIRKQMRELVNDIAAGDKTDVRELRRLAGLHPDELVLELGPYLDRMALEGIAMGVYEREKCREDLVAHIALLSDELAGDNASLARRLCAQVAAIASAEHWYLIMQAGVAGFAGHQGELPSVKRRSAAQRRFLAALRNLAQIEAAERKRPRMIDASWRSIRLEEPSGASP
jgi:hypothetical protein